ncbi:hypothetical protein ACTD5D_04315 [Nocardia takedensis]|uniref:hypothetical protein n=1 Tax=Nocardia takedensis TaxID=259390 RepID=UPI003F75E87D
MHGGGVLGARGGQFGIAVARRDVHGVARAVDAVEPERAAQRTARVRRDEAVTRRQRTLEDLARDLARLRQRLTGDRRRGDDHARGIDEARQRQTGLVDAHRDAVGDGVDHDAAHQVRDRLGLRVHPALEGRLLTAQRGLALGHVADLEAGILRGGARLVGPRPLRERDDALAGIVEPGTGEDLRELPLRRGGEGGDVLGQVGAAQVLLGRDLQIPRQRRHEFGGQIRALRRFGVHDRRRGTEEQQRRGGGDHRLLDSGLSRGGSELTNTWQEHALNYMGSRPVSLLVRCVGIRRRVFRRVESWAYPRVVSVTRCSAWCAP